MRIGLGVASQSNGMQQLVSLARLKSAWGVSVDVQNKVQGSCHYNMGMTITLPKDIDGSTQPASTRAQL